MGFLEGFLQLGSKINKVKGDYQDESEEGVVGEQISKLSLEKDDKELIELAKKWQKKWEDSPVKKDIEAKQQENEKYWLSEHYTNAQRNAGKRPLVNNLIFEALETFLPVVTRQIAEPVIETSNDLLAQAFANKVADKIKEVSDVIRLRMKVRKAVRHWAIYFLGCLKMGWNSATNEIAVQVVRPQALILDPDGVTDECEYEGEYIGHYRTDFASDLVNRFPDKEEQVKKVLGKDSEGTKIRYIEWWTNEYVFWTLKSEVLGKNKNPHWNYEEDQPVQGVNELGEPIQVGTETIEGKNHFTNPKMPFVFLSVFNLGKSPFDNTNLIEQVLPLQDVVNKRVRQIDKNADSTNGGAVVSGESFSKEQARAVGEALRKGETILVPSGDVNRAYKRDMAPALPEFIYQDLVDSRDQIRGIFGTVGLSSQGIKSEDTVRGKILVKSQDTDRSALIVDHVEQVYDYIFNWFVQLMMVYYDEPRPVSQGTEVISSQEFVYPLVVSVKEGSLIPKDRLTQRNEAIDLWTAQALDPLTLFERLEFPDPVEAARRLIAWKTNPLSLIQGGKGVPVAPEQVLPGQEEQLPQEQGSLLNQVPIQ